MGRVFHQFPAMLPRLGRKSAAQFNRRPTQIRLEDFSQGISQAHFIPSCPKSPAALLAQTTRPRSQQLQVGICLDRHQVLELDGPAIQRARLAGNLV